MRMRPQQDRTRSLWRGRHSLRRGVFRGPCAKRMVRERGMVLIASCVVLAIVLAYTNALTLHAVSQRQLIDQFHDQLHAMNLAQSVAEQYREDLFQFVRRDIYQTHFQGNALSTMAWLDEVGLGHVDLAANHDAAFDLSAQAVTGVSGRGVLGSPRQITLPTSSSIAGRAWMVGVTPTGNAL